ncbi:hypothetical protein GBA52_003790 [Prunus armeniaca]|nr:hypothetical protein GBA52_003790 [Prunus armeniaca]
MSSSWLTTARDSLEVKLDWQGWPIILMWSVLVKLIKLAQIRRSSFTCKHNKDRSSRFQLLAMKHGISESSVDEHCAAPCHV